MIKEEFKQIKETKKDLQSFGFTVGGVLVMIATLLFYFEKPSAIYLGIIGALLIIIGLIYPNILKPFNKIWMRLAILLEFFTSRVILTILFYIVLTPVSFIARLVGKKFIKLKYDMSAATYWEKRTVIQKKPIDYERQF